MENRAKEGGYGEGLEMEDALRLFDGDDSEDIEGRFRFRNSEG